MQFPGLSCKNVGLILLICEPLIRTTFLASKWRTSAYSITFLLSSFSLFLSLSLYDLSCSEVMDDWALEYLINGLIILTIKYVMNIWKGSTQFSFSAWLNMALHN